MARREIIINERPARKPPSTPAKPPPFSVIDTIPLVRSCGHSEPYNIVSEEPAEIEQARRKRSAGRGCRQCRAAAESERRAADAIRRAVKAKLREAQVAAEEANRLSGNTGLSKKERSVKRLPHGSTFTATYDSASARWTATLIAGGYEMTGTRGGLHGLIHWLAELYMNGGGRKVAP